MPSYVLAEERCLQTSVWHIFSIKKKYYKQFKIYIMEVQSNNLNLTEDPGNKNQSVGTQNMNAPVRREDNDRTAQKKVVNSQDQNQSLNSEDEAIISDSDEANIDDSDLNSYDENLNDRQDEPDDENSDGEDITG